jgi:hypothetical protein
MRECETGNLKKNRIQETTTEVHCNTYLILCFKACSIFTQADRTVCIYVFFV